MDLIKNNATETDPKEREANLREKVPDLLGPDEHVVLGYKVGRDSYVFTNKRVVVKDRMGLSSKKTEYLSVPYSAIRGYAVETAGSMDSDVELKLYVAGVGRVSTIRNRHHVFVALQLLPGLNFHCSIGLSAANTYLSTLFCPQK